jgi:hypothetical protein
MRARYSMSSSAIISEMWRIELKMLFYEEIAHGGLSLKDRLSNIKVALLCPFRNKGVQWR